MGLGVGGGCGGCCGCGFVVGVISCSGTLGGSVSLGGLSGIIIQVFRVCSAGFVSYICVHEISLACLSVCAGYCFDSLPFHSTLQSSLKWLFDKPTL